MLFAVAGGHALHPQRIREHSCRPVSPIPTLKQGGIWIGFLCATSAFSVSLWVKPSPQRHRGHSGYTEKSARKNIRAKITQLSLIWGSYNYREVCRQKFYTMMVLFKKNFRVSFKSRISDRWRFLCPAHTATSHRPFSRSSSCCLPVYRSVLLKVRTRHSRIHVAPLRIN